jgi:hypothetical protein
MNGNERMGDGKKLHNLENRNFHCLLITTEAINSEGRDEQGF